MKTPIDSTRHVLDELARAYDCKIHAFRYSESRPDSSGKGMSAHIVVTVEGERRGEMVSMIEGEAGGPLSADFPDASWTLRFTNEADEVALVLTTDPAKAHR